MSMAQLFLPEFDQEMAITRRLLERVPSDHGEWKPHPKSFNLGHLSQLVATMPGWITSIMEGTRLDLGTARAYTLEKTPVLLAMFDKNVQEARAAIAGAKDADFEVPWSLTMGDRVLMTMPRGPVVRQTINHLVHHRGQLTVYLRMVNVPIPSIYGPTADEGWGR